MSYMKILTGKMSDIYQKETLPVVPEAHPQTHQKSNLWQDKIGVILKIPVITSKDHPLKISRKLHYVNNTIVK